MGGANHTVGWQPHAPEIGKTGRHRSRLQRFGHCLDGEAATALWSGPVPQAGRQAQVGNSWGNIAAGQLPQLPYLLHVYIASVELMTGQLVDGSFRPELIRAANQGAGR